MYSASSILLWLLMNLKIKQIYVNIIKDIYIERIRDTIDIRMQIIQFLISKLITPVVKMG